MNVIGTFVRVAGAVPAIIVLSTCGTGAIKDTVTDADGNVYTTVKIGNQVWTVENLKTTKYNDGTPIPLKTERTKWAACYDSSQPAYCWYENDNGKKETYGALYNWYAVNTGKLAPKGWHVPTDADWTELEKYLMENDYNWDGSKDGQKIAKSMAARTDWLTYDEPGTIGNDLSKNNRSGFSALPGGFRLERGDFYDIGIHAYWWSATKYDESRAWRRSLYNDKINIVRHYATLHMGCGFSVRLLKD
jgi:uncharacterized protein (TIGR02145 family)